MWDDVDFGSDLARVAIAFGGGVGGNHEELCGAFTGGVMVIGKLFAPERPGGDEDRMRDAIARYRQRFLQEFGAITCDTLTNTRYGNDFEESCDDLVRQAVRILLAVIADFSENSGSQNCIW